MVCRAKDGGGLGVLNLATQSEALLLKFCTISSTKQTSLVSLSLGKSITQMVDFLALLKKGPFGGVML